MAYYSKRKTTAFKIYTRDIRTLFPPWEGLMSLHMKRRQWCGMAVEWSKRTCVVNKERSFSTYHYHLYNHQMGMTWERAKFKVQCSFDWGPGIYKAFIIPLDRDCWRRIDNYDISFLNPLTLGRDLMMMAWYTVSMSQVKIK